MNSLYVRVTGSELFWVTGLYLGGWVIFLYSFNSFIS